MTPGAPRHFVPHAGVAGAGLPSDPLRQMDRVAARRAFVELKQAFLAALSVLGEAEAAWLRAQVRSAEEPMDLWLLRAPAMAALAGLDPERRRRRQALRRALDALFPDTGAGGPPTSHFTSFY